MNYQYSGVTPFRSWCEKVLPTVYDDALSYYELLGKVVEKLNAVIHDDDITRARVDELQNFLDYLDVDTEIDKKLDEMAASGQLDPIIDRVINVQKYNSIAAVVDTNTQDINALNVSKRNIDDVGYVDMAALSNEVRMALVGGGDNIPVVGVGAVDTVNLADGAVTHEKIKKSLMPVSLWKGTIVIDNALHTITIPNGFTFTAGGTTVRCYNDITLLFSYNLQMPNMWVTFLNIYDNSTNPATITSTATISSNRDENQYVLGRLDNGVFYPASDADIRYLNVVNTDSGAGAMANTRIDKITIDFADGKIKFNHANNIVLNVGGQYVNINTTQTGIDTYQADLTIPSDITAGVVVLNTQTKLFEIKNALSSLSDTYVAVGFYNKTYNTATFSLAYDMITDGQNIMLHTSHPEIILVGDSVSAGTNTNHTWMEIANQLSGVRALNFAIGSTGWAFDLPSTEQHQMGHGTFAVGTDDYVPADNRFGSRAYDLAADTGLQNVIIFGGTNDYGKSIPISQFTSAVQLALQTLLGSTNIKNVGVVTPLKRRRGETLNAAYAKLSDYVNVIKTTCEAYGVPCLDLYSQWYDPQFDGVRAAYYTGDQTLAIHPNLAGHEKLALMIQDFIIRNFSYSTT